MGAPLEPRTSNLEPAVNVTTPCPHFGPCGVCQLQNLTYPAQFAGKAAQLRTLLDSTGLTLPELQLHASPPLGYRNRIRLTLAELDGKLRAGYLRRSTGPKAGCPTSGFSDVGATDDDDFSPAATISALAFLPITQCPIAAPILWRTAEALLAELNQRAAVWLECAPFTLDQLELFSTSDESQLQISLFVRTSAKSLPVKFEGELAGSLRIAAQPYPRVSRSRHLSPAPALRPQPPGGAVPPRTNLGRPRCQLLRFIPRTSNLEP